jgi:hypothetical protein
VCVPARVPGFEDRVRGIKMTERVVSVVYRHQARAPRASGLGGNHISSVSCLTLSVRHAAKATVGIPSSLGVHIPVTSV